MFWILRECLGLLSVVVLVGSATLLAGGLVG